MNKKIKILLATCLLVAGIAFPAKAAYYDHGGHGNCYVGKLDIWMEGSTRKARAGTYVEDDRFIVNTIRARVVDNGVLKREAEEHMSPGATTQEVVVHYSGVTGEHYVYSPTYGDWTDGLT